METRINRKAIRRRVRYRIRKKVGGTATCPRLAVFRSAQQIYAQVIDDESGRTVAQASTVDPALRGGLAGKGGTIQAAKQVGAAIAERVQGVGVESVTFDRGGFAFHGRIKALADAAREAGLKF